MPQLCARNHKSKDEDEGIPRLRASKLPDFFEDSRSEASPSGTDAQCDGATAPSEAGSPPAGEIRSAGAPQSRTAPIEGDWLASFLGAPDPSGIIQPGNSREPRLLKII